MTSHHAIEVTKTVLEVADVAWTAVETYHHHHHHHDENHESTNPITDPRDRELEALRQENRRLRTLLEANLKLFETLAESAALSHDCPSDLYARLVSMVTSKDFLARLEKLRQALSNGTQNQFPFKEPTEDDVKTVEVLIEMDHQEPSWWVLVTDDMVPSNVEEQSAIDNDHYIVVNEEHVIDAVAHFLAKCIMSNPKAKNLKPDELQKLLVQEVTALSKVGKVVDIWHAGKMFYTLSTWGLAFGGLYQARGALKIAAKGVHATSKVVLRAL
ncbi:unnamed protein product [Arabidopsis lyrata]|uniref:Uncharacterized protein n=1 Tax=Arabidopsis lyrata subsp. lyrata TaxID=81972 RepID=D7KNT7_ARALL|nr:uncharacterized protein LOC9330054 isoform X1 [Arabidopsis lyrata subsp. lyrata]EFH70252.1 hypothetical protein ARALYDRAFT_473819 [Arabidopsis lyrata subsp. lyrata]CAH8254681.1 unnamed protein product [Arabidopsis lyrata]|eukprot:XP_020870057.1 uncharacterized protein LOC9330054 isoform X1 [Arabidopsis lyrata subsp. lyrata]